MKDGDKLLTYGVANGQRCIAQQLEDGEIDREI